MANFTQEQYTNLLSIILLKNEASAKDWYKLSNAGINHLWGSNPTLVDIDRNLHGTKTTGASGFSVGLAQLDFANNKYANGLAGLIAARVGRTCLQSAV